LLTEIALDVNSLLATEGSDTEENILTAVNYIRRDISQINREVNPTIIDILCSQTEKINLLNVWSGELNRLYLTIFSVKESIYKLFSSLDFEKMEWFDYCVVDFQEQKQAEVLCFKIKLPDHFLNKTSRTDLKILPELDVYNLRFGGYLISFVYCAKD
jgi:4'-phosphopantetheinyl transferase EntD